MGAALIVPVLAILAAIVIWIFFFAGRTAKQAQAEKSLPTEPYARRDEEVRRLRQEHAEARPENVTHPERRP